MSEEVMYISQYPNVDLSYIEMKWNGKRGFAFDDANQGFRERIIILILKDTSKVSDDLIYSLMHEEAVWANKTLTYRYYLPKLAEYLLIKDLKGYGQAIAQSFSGNKHAMKCMADFTVEDETIKKWLDHYQSLAIVNGDSTKDLSNMTEELQQLLYLRSDKEQKTADFEAYITHIDSPKVAIKKSLKRFWFETELHYLALFFIIPLVLLFGYYYYGLSILYAMLPIFRALMLIYIIYKIAHKIVG